MENRPDLKLVAELENRIKDYTDEDLMEYIETEFDVKPELIVNRRLDSKWAFKSHILED
ncbi:TPA: hypothetical protein ACG7LI_001046 [Streptococcus agalactiae]|uniref:hypothetical protein n=1 Tax=Streptococcus agalactiae TaxID=1311 RepID=UPI00031FFCA5|nr:hypothetical protein [Streptococcus agalactiae]EPU92341.1 hypothetical protein SAG0319_07230 [Streptococcus agalactiae GB00241]EPU93778.1 hypothetical protein SAG0319_10860 [Streptococcus agalactiae GB00241]EPX40554.1 hypothetical protein SAG0343_01985 [Streptococcus agalactiae GB00874]MCW1398694.1 hypothetical protein [Streptococcus agalactiae]MCW1638468.1 hypothetical protein [Streptococcus agalactiae]